MSEQNLVFLGPPGAGKGTQTKRLCQKLGVPQISTGDMLREAREAGTELGKKADAFMKQGSLVPDEIVIGLVEERLKRNDTAGGFILDGFPRTTSQAQTLDKLLGNLKRQLNCVILLDLPDELILERITGRRVGETSGRIYHIKYDPPPFPDKGVDGERLIIRNDDQEDVVKPRLANYAAQTAPLIVWYTEKGLLRRVDGVGTVDDVTKRVEKAVGF